MVHTCPRCELRFTTSSELTQHLAADHGVNAEQFERLRYPADARAGNRDIDVRPYDDGQRYLVVANRTALDKRLFEHLKDLGKTSPSRFHVVVPAIRSGRPASDVSAGLAQWRLDTLLERLREAKLDAGGELGDSDPFRAACHVVESEPFDQVIVSTLPAGTSNWLDADLPGRLRHKLHLPVIVVKADSALTTTT